MLLLLLLMYRKNVLGLTFHEIGGMAVCGLFIIHKLFNGKWILLISGKLFSKKTPKRAKLNWLVDFLLILCFVYILVSGILISQVVFAGQRGASSFTMGHYAASALALVLLGIHLGLHYEFILGRTPARKLPLWLRRVTAVAMSAAILGFGAYEMTATSFLRWIGNLGSAIGAGSVLPEGDFGDRQLTEGMPGEFQPSEITEGSQTGTTAPADAQTALGDRGRVNGESAGPVGDGSWPAGSEGFGSPERGGDGIDASAIGAVLLDFLSITLVTSVVTAWIEGIPRSRRQKWLLKGVRTS